MAGGKGLDPVSDRLLRRELTWLREELGRVQVGNALWRHMMRRVGDLERELERRTHGQSSGPSATD